MKNKHNHLDKITSPNINKTKGPLFTNNWESMYEDTCAK